VIVQRLPSVVSTSSVHRALSDDHDALISGAMTSETALNCQPASSGGVVMLHGNARSCRSFRKRQASLVAAGFAQSCIQNSHGIVCAIAIAPPGFLSRIIPVRQATSKVMLYICTMYRTNVRINDELAPPCGVDRQR
jgi:hypothetical protein